MSTRLRPALTPEQWSNRSIGSISINLVERDVSLTIRGARDEVTSVSGADQLCRLIALANGALPECDPRKISAEDVATLRSVAAALNEDGALEPALLELSDRMCEKVAALLAPR